MDSGLPSFPGGLDRLVVGSDLLDRGVARVRRILVDDLAEGRIRHPHRSRRAAEIAERTPPQIAPERRQDVHASQYIPELEKFATPNLESAVAYDAEVPKDAVRVLAENLEALMEYARKHRRPQGTIPGVAEAGGCGVGSVHRALEGSTSLGLSVVDKLARAFRLQAYQLLTPGLDPANPHWLPVTDEEKKALRVARLAIQMQQHDEGVDADEGESTEVGSSGRRSGDRDRTRRGPGEGPRNATKGKRARTPHKAQK